jgi:serine/threonine-protein kinase RsbW
MPDDTGGEYVIPSDLEAARRVQDRIEAVVKTAFAEHEAFAVKMAVEEALVNAIKHGNQMDPEKSVRVTYTLGPERFDVRITDEGPGFNPDDVPDPTAPENLERPCGRGLLLIRYYMTDVSFLDNGRTIAMHKVRNGPK